MNAVPAAESLQLALEAARRLRAGEAFWYCGAELEARSAAGSAGAVLKQAALLCSPRGFWIASLGEDRFSLLLEAPLDEAWTRRTFAEALRRLGAPPSGLRLGQVRCSPGAYARLEEVRRAARRSARGSEEEGHMEMTFTLPNFFRGAGAFLLMSVWLAAGCAGPQSRVHQGRIDAVIDQDPTRRGYLEAIGIGAADPTLPTDTQRKALARDAAIVKAQYEMLSMIKGVTLEGGLTVERAIETGSVIETSLKETIRGAEVLKSEFTADNGCVVTLRLPRARLEKMMGVRFR